MRHLLMLVSLLIALPAAAAGNRNQARLDASWVALHLLGFQNDADLESIETQLPDVVGRGVSVLVLEVDYGFEFRTHPELRIAEKVITRERARRFVQACRKRGIRVVPQFQSLGHQSWAKDTWPLLTKYPDLDSTPGAFQQNERICCREWDPMNPRVYEIVYARGLQTILWGDPLIDAQRYDHGEWEEVKRRPLYVVRRTLDAEADAGPTATVRGTDEA